LMWSMCPCVTRTASALPALNSRDATPASKNTPISSIKKPVRSMARECPDNVQSVPGMLQRWRQKLACGFCHSLSNCLDNDAPSPQQRQQQFTSRMRNTPDPGSVPPANCSLLLSSLRFPLCCFSSRLLPAWCSLCFAGPTPNFSPSLSLRSSARSPAVASTSAWTWPVKGPSAVAMAPQMGPPACKR